MALFIFLLLVQSTTPGEIVVVDSVKGLEFQERCWSISCSKTIDVGWKAVCRAGSMLYCGGEGRGEVSGC